MHTGSHYAEAAISFFGQLCHTSHHPTNRNTWIPPSSYLIAMQSALAHFPLVLVEMESSILFAVHSTFHWCDKHTSCHIQVKIWQECRPVASFSQLGGWISHTFTTPSRCTPKLFNNFPQKTIQNVIMFSNFYVRKRYTVRILPTFQPNVPQTFYFPGNHHAFHDRNCYIGKH